MWVNSNGVVNLRSAHYQVMDVLELGIPPNIGNAEATPLIGLHRIWSYAAKRCGKRVADVSWAVVFNVPESQAAAYATGVAYLAPTRQRRWRIWYAQVL
jgi:hypothetical protein